MNPLRIKDNHGTKKELFSSVDSLTSKIADKTLSQLQKDGLFIFPESLENADDLEDAQMVLKSVNDSYWSTNVMGFLGYGDERLIIESRFSEVGNDFFLQYLLNRVLGFPNILSLNSDANSDDQLFDFLLFCFPYYLKQAMRKGLFKEYVRHQYNDMNVRGTIDVARHIRANTPFIGKIAYSQREFSYDNFLTELIRHTIEMIKAKPYGRVVLSKVKDEVRNVVDATQHYTMQDRRKIINANKRNTVRHAYYHEYRSLQHLCLLILQHEKQSIGKGTETVQGVLFDGAWLWEEYINSLIGDLFYHPQNKAKEGKQLLFEGNNGEIYPDFISRNHESRVIADAKYKPTKNINGRDYQQVLAYMFRFDAKKGYYLYPSAEGYEDRRLRLNQGSTYENNVLPRDDIFVEKHGLRIPTEDTNYEQYVSEMQTNEQIFIQAFNSLRDEETPLPDR